MQLLEQLAYGDTSNCSLESISMECASIQGYMECMNELYKSEVILEGTSAKDTIKKIGDLISHVLEKFKKFCEKVVGFFKRKIEEFKTKFNRKHRDKGEENKSENRTTNAKEQESISEIFEKYRYSGLNPEKIFDASKAVRDASNRIVNAILDEVHYINQFDFEKIAEGKIEKQTELDTFLSTNIKTVLNRVIDKSVDDEAGISKFIEKIYTDISRVSVYKNYKLTMDELGVFDDNINFTIEYSTKTFNSYIDTFNKSLPETINGMNYIEDIKVREDLLSEKSVQYTVRAFQKVFSHITLCLNICSSMVSAISKVFDNLKDDAEMVRNYISGMYDRIYC